MEELKNYEEAIDKVIELVPAEAMERTGMSTGAAIATGGLITLATVGVVKIGMWLWDKHQEKKAFKPAADLKIVADEAESESEE